MKLTAMKTIVSILLVGILSQCDSSKKDSSKKEFYLQYDVGDKMKFFDGTGCIISRKSTFGNMYRVSYWDKKGNYCSVWVVEKEIHK